MFYSELFLEDDRLLLEDFFFLKSSNPNFSTLNLFSNISLSLLSLLILESSYSVADADGYARKAAVLESSSLL